MINRRNDQSRELARELPCPDYLMISTTEADESSSVFGKVIGDSLSGAVVKWLRASGWYILRPVEFIVSGARSEGVRVSKRTKSSMCAGADSRMGSVPFG